MTTVLVHNTNLCISGVLCSDQVDEGTSCEDERERCLVYHQQELCIIEELVLDPVASRRCGERPATPSVAVIHLEQIGHIPLFEKQIRYRMSQSSLSSRPTTFDDDGA
jgi:hypothetical protein